MLTVNSDFPFLVPETKSWFLVTTKFPGISFSLLESILTSYAINLSFNLLKGILQRKLLFSEVSYVYLR
jgi:hypothetical protein